MTGSLIRRGFPIVSLVCVGIDHHTAPVALRERFALGPDAQRRFLQSPSVSQLHGDGLAELVVLSTCNRTEVYAAPVADAEPLLELLASLAELPLTTITPHTETHRGPDAIRHLCRVAAGLESMVLGESEILGQVATAFETAAHAGAIGPILDAAFHTALRAGRRARAETSISRLPTSVSTEAVRLIADVVGAPERAGILIVGTGKMGRLAGQALRDHGGQRLTVVSRTAAHAEQLAQEWGAAALAWHDLPAAIAAADAVLCSTGAPHAVVTRELVERAIGPTGDGRRRVFVDIAVPRDVEPAVAKLPGVEVYDLDSLQQRLQGNLELRRREIPGVEHIISEEVGRFESWHHGNSVRPLLTEMHARGEAIRRREVQRLLHRLGNPSPELAAELEAFSQSLVTKLLHEPTRRLREASDPERARTYRDVTRALFGLGDGGQAVGGGAA
jgi:glutamyl-tRNA reductase